MATEKKQVSPSDEKWANKSWKPFLWMAIGGTVLLIIGLVLFIVSIFIATNPDEPATAVALLIFGYILMIAGALVTEGGIALIIVTMIKSNKAKARLGLKK